MPSRNRDNGAGRPKSRRNAKQPRPELSPNEVEKRVVRDDEDRQVERRKRPRDQRRSPRTASGKRSDPQLLAKAAVQAQDDPRRRPEPGARAAGRTPPSQQTS